MRTGLSPGLDAKADSLTPDAYCDSAGLKMRLSACRPNGAEDDRWPSVGTSGNRARMTTNLDALLTDPSRRPALVRDLARVVEEEVASKKGLSGIALKATFGLVTGVRPGFLAEAVDYLLDGSVAGLRPLIEVGAGQGQGVAAALRANPPATASALLRVVDDRISRSKNQTLRKAYEKLRGSAQKQVEEAVPRLADTLERHVP